MPKTPRSCLPPEGFFHVTARGVFKARIYLDDTDRDGFVRLLERCIEMYGWTCHTYCLMSTHYHLVVDAKLKALSDGMRRLNGLHALGFNRRHRRYGALFAERFSTRLIESEEYLFDACNYVLLNPVRAGLCDRAEDWPWSYSSFSA